MKVLLKLLMALLGFFGATVLIYWFNLDMKLMKRVYFLLGKHYDTMKRDRKL